MSDYINTAERGEQAMIKDSGERREYATGAVRDMAEGKGRCDLLPLDVAASFISPCSVLYHMSCFMESRKLAHLKQAVAAFCWNVMCCIWTIMHKGEKGCEQ